MGVTALPAVIVVFLETGVGRSELRHRIIFKKILRHPLTRQPI
jgi:hypothetical protein